MMPYVSFTFEPIDLMEAQQVCGEDNRDPALNVSVQGSNG